MAKENEYKAIIKNELVKVEKALCVFIEKDLKQVLPDGVQKIIFECKYSDFSERFPVVIYYEPVEENFTMRTVDGKEAKVRIMNPSFVYVPETITELMNLKALDDFITEHEVDSLEANVEVVKPWLKKLLQRSSKVFASNFPKVKILISSEEEEAEEVKF